MWALGLEVGLKLNLNNPITVHSLLIYADGGSRKLFLKDKTDNVVGIKLDRKIKSTTKGKFFIDTSSETSSLVNSEEEVDLKHILDNVITTKPEERETIELFKSYL